MMLSNEINNDLQQQHDVVLPLHYSSSSSSYDVDFNRRTKTASARRRRRISKRTTTTAANLLVVMIMSSIFVICFLANRHIENQLRERNRHPLSFPKRKLNEDDGSLKYLTLGGPSTWGQGLDSPQNQAYPYLLSPNVHNAAQRVGGPTLASLCTESIVGPEEIYDVIVLQFESELTSALPLLAQRLRRRFPLAEFVFVNLWSPSRYVQNENEEDDNHNTSLSIAQWKYSNNETRKDFHDYDWIYKGNNEDEMNALNKVVEATQGKLYQLPPPNPNELSMEIVEEMFLEIHRDEFFDLSYTLSPHGHQVVADGILSLLGDDLDLLLAKKKQQRSINGDVDAVVVVGDWGDGDSCHIWYDTGLGVPEFSRLIFSRFANNEKYALEVPSPTGGVGGDHGGSITINNPFNESRMVYLTYMTTNSASSNKIYPRTKVQIISVNNDDDDDDHNNNKGESSSALPAAAAVILDPYANDDDDTNNNSSNNKQFYHSRHITRTSAVGNILPGRETTIRLTPMENTAANFRLVGASLLATEKTTHNIASTEFDLGPEAAHVFEVFGPSDLDI